jgi:hypothetical protein
VRETFPVPIKDAATGNLVEATLIVGLHLDEVDEAVGLWAPFLKKEEARRGKRVDHGHWDWSYKARRIRGLANYLILGIECQSEMQALLLWDDLHSQAKHPQQLGKDLVYVNFVSTAPWNDIEVVDYPRFRGAGSTLMVAAIERSLDLEYKGRVGLHSLKGAESFYRKCGMIDLGIDKAHETLRYFEFTPEAANTFLQKIKQEDKK